MVFVALVILSAAFWVIQQNFTPHSHAKFQNETVQSMKPINQTCYDLKPEISNRTSVCYEPSKQWTAYSLYDIDYII